MKFLRNLRDRMVEQTRLKKDKAQLREMTDRQLRDIGLTRNQINFLK